MVSSAADDFGKIGGFLSDMLGKLEIFRGFEEHFKPAPNKSWDHLYDALANFYIDVIDFTLVAAKYYRRGAFSTHLRSSRFNLFANYCRIYDAASDKVIRR